MKIAIPIAEGRLAQHFGHAAEFSILDVEDGADCREERQTPPAHEPGVLPAWLQECGVDVVICGGMGRRAQDLFAEQGIRVIVGAPSDAPLALAQAFLADKLEAGENVCDH